MRFLFQHPRRRRGAHHLGRAAGRLRPLCLWPARRPGSAPAARPSRSRHRPRTPELSDYRTSPNLTGTDVRRRPLRVSETQVATAACLSQIAASGNISLSCSQEERRHRSRRSACAPADVGPAVHSRRAASGLLTAHRGPRGADTRPGASPEQAAATLGHRTGAGPSRAPAAAVGRGTRRRRGGQSPAAAGGLSTGDAPGPCRGGGPQAGT